jgi:hypothetical protein
VTNEAESKVDEEYAKKLRAARIRGGIALIIGLAGSLKLLHKCLGGKCPVFFEGR